MNKITFARITFKTKIYITMKLLGSTKNKLTKDKNDVKIEEFYIHLFQPKNLVNC